MHTSFRRRRQSRTKFISIPTHTHSTLRPLPCACTTSLVRSICAHGLHLSTPHIRAIEQRARAREGDRVNVDGGWGNAHIYLPSMLPANKRHRPHRWRISDTFCEGRKIEGAVLVYSQNTHRHSFTESIHMRTKHTYKTHTTESLLIYVHIIYIENIFTHHTKIDLSMCARTPNREQQRRRTTRRRRTRRQRRQQRAAP